jgi:hypothetical protein
VFGQAFICAANCPRSGGRSEATFASSMAARKLAFGYADCECGAMAVTPGLRLILCLSPNYLRRSQTSQASSNRGTERMIMVVGKPWRDARNPPAAGPRM